MENAVDALKMAGSVLLFVIALSVAILAFTQSRQAIDTMLKYSDREALTIEGDPRFYYLSEYSDTSRYVGKETIIPTIYRAYKENYKIIFNFPDNYYIFEQNGEKVCKIDMDSENLSIPKNADEKFVNGILYGDYELKDFKNTFGVEPNTTISLYEYLTEKESKYKIKEELGTYYINDVKRPEDTEEKSPIQDVNKQEKRVITYTFEQQ